MNAPIVELADAVTQALNRPGLPLAFTAERSYLTALDPESLGELETLSVTVQPARMVGLRTTRAEEQVDYGVVVAVQQKVDARDLRPIDALMGLTQGIIDRLLKEPLPGAKATCVGYESETAYSEEDLTTKQLFTSVVAFTFRGAR